MAYLLNDPSAFTDEMVDGFVSANADLVRRVEGGVVRTSRTAPGEVAVVIGGGSGHYPAFAGLVGQGLAHGAAMGNVFASPSANQIYSVATAVASDAGVLFSYGNYAGDVLNFDQAQERLIAAGIPCRTVTVTDDICSADAAEQPKRRGIAGDLAVFRAAAWASGQGHDLDGVYAAAVSANERTRSLGVAFSGCTLPGATAPLFTVAPGRMAVGMGIHGEPGIEEGRLPTADELATLFVDRLLAARPTEIAETRGARAGVMLNGLGSVKYEELFVVYRSVAVLLERAGVAIVQPEVGELVTSFEMAGVSLTLVWLDEELERAWTAPAYTPAYRKGAVAPGKVDAAGMETASVAAEIPAGDAGSQAAADAVVRAVDAIKRVIDDHVEELGGLDAIAGDGDHGIGMQRGATAALSAADTAAKAGAGAGFTLNAAADAWADRGGGTSGALWGVGLRAVAAHLGDETSPTAAAVAAGVSDAAERIGHVGKAQVGDKTMLDALVPFAGDLAARVASGDPLGYAWTAAAAAATVAAQSTATLVPRVGRARPHQNRSVGTPDPGAVSLALAVTAVAATFTTNKEVTR